MATSSTDLRYGRQGGRIVSGSSVRPRGSGPPCQECGHPMVAGQRVRHYTCSPPVACCGLPSDLIPDLARHQADHHPDPATMQGHTR